LPTYPSQPTGAIILLTRALLFKLSEEPKTQNSSVLAIINAFYKANIYITLPCPKYQRCRGFFTPIITP
jgi:hypothetical protein